MQQLARPLRLLVLPAVCALLAALVEPPSARAQEGPSEETILVTGAMNPDDLTRPPATVTMSLTGEIRVSNPGLVPPIDQQCFARPDGQQTCVGAPGELNLGRESTGHHVEVRSGSLLNYGIGSTAPLAWVIDEARAAVASMHGVANDDRLDAYGRPEIRNYVELRLRLILERRLYGKPLDEQEQLTYDWMMQQVNAREAMRARHTLEEYRRWEASPCGYDVPKPPVGSGLPFVPNPQAETSNCRVANSAGNLFRITKGTPPAETFQNWADYRHPSPAMKASGLPVFRQMAYQDSVGSVFLAGVGAALVSGVVTGAAVALTPALASAISAATAVATHALADLAAAYALAYGVKLAAAKVAVAGPASGIVAGATASAASIGITAILTGLLAIGVSSWMLAEEERIASTIADRARDAGTSTDPLGIVAMQATYAALDFDKLENPPSGARAFIHTYDFAQQLRSLVLEWTAFDEQGRLIPDSQAPQSPPAPGAAADERARFVVNGQVRDWIEVIAPPNSVNAAGERVGVYRVWLDRGWLLVSEYVRGVYSPAVPRLFVNYVDDTGRPAVMAIVRPEDDQGRVTHLFGLARSESAGELPRQKLAAGWKVSSPVGHQTVGLQVGTPLMPEVSLLPTATADSFTPGQLVKLQPNVSDAGRDATGGYSWVIERLAGDGSVLESTAYDGLLAFTQRFSEPGDYRARVRFGGTRAGSPFDVTGVVEFTILRPQPEVVKASLRDDALLEGRLLLDLQLTERVQQDTLDVKVAWADDAAGNRVVKDYTVRCENVGVGECDTGRFIGDTDPENPRWSEVPSYRIPQDQAFLPQVTVTVSSKRYGTSTELVLQGPGEHRPRFEDPTPFVQMEAGTMSTVPVTEVKPPTVAGAQEFSLRPFAYDVERDLPRGVTPIVMQDDGRWYIGLTGKPVADDIGPHTFYISVVPAGPYDMRPPPALVTLDVVASTEPGYRAVLRDAPGYALYRTGPPPYLVQVTQALGPEEDASFAPFTGTVRCRLTGEANAVLLDTVCVADRPFPWPAGLDDETLTAEVWVESESQPTVDEHYVERFALVQVRPELTVARAAEDALRNRLNLSVTDRKYAAGGGVLPPFSARDYIVSCAVDGGAWRRCLDSGSTTVLRVPGRHTVTVRVTAPDGATVTDALSWTVTTPPRRLTVRRPVYAHRRGTRVLVVAHGLLPRERYAIRVAGHRVATGTATTTGAVRRYVRIPITTRLGIRSLVVRGATVHRTGSTTVRVTGVT